MIGHTFIRLLAIVFHHIFESQVRYKVAEKSKTLKMSELNTLEIFTNLFVVDTFNGIMENS